MTKFLKISAIIVLTLLAVVCALFLTYLFITKDCYLDKNKLLNIGENIVICDNEGNEIVNASLTGKRTTVKIGELNEDTVNAFIASEDRTFYSHHGLNYKRMVKAFYTNLTSRSFKEGASTISQQLIKNTHLSNDKTITRKLKEINLTRKLERNYSKDDILEMYLNTIYFGHNCYGLQSASQFYFDKRAEELNLQESATLVGLLTSPNNYSPFKNPEKSLKRRNIVLKAMLDCNKITAQEYECAVNSPIEAKRSGDTGKYADYINAVFDELEEIPLDIYELAEGCLIKTYMDSDLQTKIERLQFDCDNSVIITQNGGVSAYKSTIGGAKRQPGSTAKPLMVYGPAIQENLLSPYTRILDDKIDFNGYSPENFDKKYHGQVSVADSLKYSYNIPAVKALNVLTVPKSEKYLKNMNIALEDEEKNLSLALGGMKYGLTLQEIADGYSVFSAGGTFTPSRFIREITTKDGKTLYKNESGKTRVFSQGTCSLMNEMLLETSKSGTAKKLKKFDFDIASKTGTCGNSEGNTDAYAISYTSRHTIGVWLGDKENHRLSVTGGSDCCQYMVSVLNMLYSESKPAKLDTTSGTSQIFVDAEEYYRNDKIIIADDLCPKLNVLTLRTLKGNEPKEKSDRFTHPSIPTPSITTKNGVVNIELCHAKYYSFLVKRGKNNDFTEIYNGKWQSTICDSPENGYYTYSVTPYFESDGVKHFGKTILLPPVNLNQKNQAPQVKIPDIANEDWFNM